MSGLAQAVEAFNQAAADLETARRALHRAIDQDRRENPRVARCGTPAQYRAHLDRGEQCAACTEAHRRDTLHRKRRTRSA